MTAPPNLTPSQRIAWNDVAHIWPFWGRQAGPPPLKSLGLENDDEVKCYQNTVIQCILHAPKFINWLDLHCASCTIQNCIACSLGKVSTLYWQPSRNRDHVDREVKVYRERHKQAGWTLQGQQDAHDYYMSLVDRLTSQCYRDKTVLEALFKIKTTSTLKCPSCGHESSTLASDSSLVCTIPTAGNLADIVRDHVFAPETLDDVQCGDPGCGFRSDRQRRRIINVPPDILVIQLVRFQYFPERKKLRTLISIPEHLDLSDFCEGTGQFAYQLFGVIKHVGGLNRGHYVAVTEGPGEKWELIDDFVVTSTEVDHASNSDRGFYPYVMFYKKVYNDDKVAEDSLRASPTNPAGQSPGQDLSIQAGPLIIAHEIAARAGDTTPPPKTPSTTFSSPVTSPEWPTPTGPPSRASALIINHLIDIQKFSPPPPSRYSPRLTRSRARARRVPKYLLPERPTRVQPYRVCRDRAGIKKL